jgi:hypothetical protein
MFGNFSETQRIVLYTVGYMLMFVLSVIGFLAAILIIEHVAVDPASIFIIASVLFFGYVLVQIAIMNARSHVRDEAEREQKIIKNLSNDN